jgi:predicted RNA methylase
MGKHETSYLRVDRDFYPTPAWTTAALLEVIDVAGKNIWECACGDGRMAEPLKAAGARVFCTDIVDRGYAAFDGVLDFLSNKEPALSFDGIITNPPWGPQGKLEQIPFEFTHSPRA